MKDCNCTDNSSKAGSLSNSVVNNTGKLAVAKVPQGYDQKINVRFVPATEIGLLQNTGCQPRKGADRRNAEAVALPETLVLKFKEANKKVVEWLANDKANAQLFLQQPVEALQKAGVELSRAEQKLLARTISEANQAAVIAPGVNVKSLTATGDTTGRVGEKKFPTTPKDNGTKTNDCGC